MNLFSGTVAWKLLCFFFEKPEREGYVQELARSTKLSAGSISVACSELAKGGLLRRAEKGNALFYSLDSTSPLVKRLKSAWFLSKLLPFKKAWENENFQSLVLYGSRAAGEFISKSDIDILVITNMESMKVYELFRTVQEAMGAEVTVTSMPLSRWRKMARGRDRFYTEVISNHILLYGTSPVVG